jgi:tetratricopeptide (TPR) repeat protein
MEPDIENSQFEIADWLREGITAAKAGQRKRARELLTRVVEQDEGNAQAWLWLSGVVDSLEDREICLENVLTIDPENAAARRGLAWVREQMQQSEAQVPESPVVARAHTPISSAAALLREDFASSRLSPQSDLEAIDPSVPIQDSSGSRPLPEPVPESFPAAPRREFDDEYLCPYCTVNTEPEDRRCRSCGGNLWVRFRKQEKRSSLLWILLALQVGNAIYSALPVFLLYFLGPTFGRLFSLQALPSYLLYLLALPSFFSLVLALGLYVRWRPVYYLLMIDAGFSVALAVMAFAFVAAISGIVGFVLALGRFMLVLQLGGDFEWDRRRILFRTDRGLKESVEYMTRADHYNRQKMWGLAALHIRAALGLMPDRLDCHMALVVAYTRLKRHNMAEHALAQAKRLAPGDPRLVEMEAVLQELRSGGMSAQAA